MADHTLVKSADDEYTIECSDPDQCLGWLECLIDVEHTSEPEHYSEPEDGDEATFHGVVHEWRDEAGWVLLIEGCAVVEMNYCLPDEADDLPPGRYPVSDEFDEGDVYLELREVTEP